MKNPGAQDRMLKAIAEYLASEGWNVAVIGASRVQGPVERRYIYELVFRFTGEKRAIELHEDATQKQPRQARAIHR